MVTARIWSEMEPDFDRAEPNDQFVEAKALPPGGETRLYLFPRGDQDWFRLEVPTSGLEQRIELALSREGRQVFPEGLELGVTDTKGRPVVQRLGTPDDEGNWKPVPFQLDPGNYRFWIRARGDRSWRSALTLRVHSTPIATVVAKEPAPLPTSPAVPELPKAIPPPPKNVPPPALEPVLGHTAERPRERGSTWLWALAVLGLLFAFWLGPLFLRPRRVFDLTR
jgi:hypothetical protein